MITYVHLELRQIYCPLEIVLRGNSTVMKTHNHYFLPNEKEISHGRASWQHSERTP